MLVGADATDTAAGAEADTGTRVDCEPIATRTNVSSREHAATRPSDVAIVNSARNGFIGLGG